MLWARIHKCWRTTGDKHKHFPSHVLYWSTLQDRLHGTSVNKTLNWNSQNTRHICPFQSGRSLYRTHKVSWGLMTQCDLAVEVSCRQKYIFIFFSMRVIKHDIKTFYWDTCIPTAFYPTQHILGMYSSIKVFKLGTLSPRVPLLTINRF